ncbi:hypothetical protein L486_02411 [Kwoniella mangroviensis CBS 10435]|uniref:Uncharacterized protein n=1 Tax=Kwoniella mangroviensis CBS 10435 TaxID=1331196 RepID=A0A1B9IW30_9TREE|nr:hypothetical protein L486_02411 [Kwoniella mangroviensis CBS 10435]
MLCFQLIHLVYLTGVTATAFNPHVELHDRDVDSPSKGDFTTSSMTGLDKRGPTCPSALPIVFPPHPPPPANEVEQYFLPVLFFNDEYMLGTNTPLPTLDAPRESILVYWDYMYTTPTTPLAYGISTMIPRDLGTLGHSATICAQSGGGSTAISETFVQYSNNHPGLAKLALPQTFDRESVSPLVDLFLYSYGFFPAKSLSNCVFTTGDTALIGAYGAGFSKPYNITCSQNIPGKIRAGMRLAFDTNYNASITVG